MLLQNTHTLEHLGILEESQINFCLKVFGKGEV
jgi:hypothetical protein